jgi:hypothetical protein
MAINKILLKLIGAVAILQVVSRRHGFDSSSGHVGFVVDILALGRIFSKQA